MTDLLRELEEKRSKQNIEAEKHKYARDRLNEETKRWVSKRDQLNAQVRELIEKANTHRTNRDELNKKVQEAKKERDYWNKKVNELNEEVLRLKKENMPKSGPPLGRLKRELRQLEFKQMTSVLTSEKEKELIELLSRVQTEIKEREAVLEENEEVRKAVAEAKEAKEKAEGFHRDVGEFAEKAQTEHDQMLQLYETADSLRKEADHAQEKFIETKLKADEEHRLHVEYIHQVHDYDKIISGLRQKQRKAKKLKEKTSAKREAEDIYEKFRAGEKLSTEDLMTLQKSGYL